MRLRQGRKVGRTLYVQLQDHPSDVDVLVGVVDSPELAAFLVDAVCWYLERAERRDPGERTWTATKSTFSQVASSLVNRPKGT